MVHLVFVSPRVRKGASPGARGSGAREAIGRPGEGKFRRRSRVFEASHGRQIVGQSSILQGSVLCHIVPSQIVLRSAPECGNSPHIRKITHRRAVCMRTDATKYSGTTILVTIGTKGAKEHPERRQVSFKRPNPPPAERNAGPGAQKHRRRGLQRPKAVRSMDLRGMLHPPRDTNPGPGKRYPGKNKAEGQTSGRAAVIRGPGARDTDRAPEVRAGPSAPLSSQGE